MAYDEQLKYKEAHPEGKWPSEADMAAGSWNTSSLVSGKMSGTDGKDGKDGGGGCCCAKPKYRLFVYNCLHFVPPPLTGNHHAAVLLRYVRLGVPACGETKYNSSDVGAMLPFPLA